MIGDTLAVISRRQEQRACLKQDSGQRGSFGKHATRAVLTPCLPAIYRAPFGAPGLLCIWSPMRSKGKEEKERSSPKWTKTMSMSTLLSYNAVFTGGSSNST